VTPSEGLIALRLLACLAALVGGLVWVVFRLVDGLPDVVYWVGLALVALALAGAGAGLVKRSAVGLRLVVALAFPALVLSLYSAIRPADERLVDLGGGGLAALVGIVFALRRSRSAEHQRYHGSHAR
jgi:hypothetical protein